MIWASPQRALPASHPNPSSCVHSCVLVTPPDTPDNRRAPPRSPTRMGFRDFDIHHAFSPPVTPPTPSAPELGPTLEDPTSDGEEWSDDIVLVDNTPISYILSSSQAATQDEDSTIDVYDDDSLPAHSQTGAPAEPHGPCLPTRFSHHGLSRSALQHQKWLWGARYEEWLQWQADVEEAASGRGVYGGILDPASIEPPAGLRSRTQIAHCTSPSPPRPTTPPPTSPSLSKELNPNIFPRTGDLASLHDPHAARVDRFFGHYPLSTLQKALFAVSLQAGERAELRSMSSSTSVAEPATPASDLSHYGDNDSDGAGDESYPRTLLRAQPSTSPRRSDDYWDARWEVFQELVALSEGAPPAPSEPRCTLGHTSFGLPVVVRTLDVQSDDDEAEVEPRPRTRFYIASAADDDHDDHGVGGSPGPLRADYSRMAYADVRDEFDDDDDDDEDYGEILPNPRFRGPFVTEAEVLDEHDHDHEHEHELDFEPEHDDASSQAVARPSRYSF